MTEFGDITKNDLLSLVSELYSTIDTGNLDCAGEAIPIFTFEDVQIALKKMKNGRTCDSQGISIELFKWGGDELYGLLGDLCNEALLRGYFPTEWCLNRVVPVHKTGDKDDIRNYRTILVSNTFAKLFASMLLTEGAKGAGNKRFLAFIDLTKAFDRVNRTHLAERLERLQVPIELRKAVACLYNQVLVELSFPFSGSDQIKNTIGVKQGCPCSPTLFGLLIDELECWMTRLGGMGARLGKYILQLLMFADDIVLISRDAGGLQRHLDVLESFCTSKQMQINVNKSKIMVFGGKDCTIFTVGGVPLQKVTEYKYLGIDMTCNYRWTRAAQKRASGGLRAFYGMIHQCRLNNFEHWKLRRLLFGVQVKPIILYGSPVWGPGLCWKCWNAIENVQRHFLLSELGAKPQTPYCMMLAETGMLPLEAEALCRTITYVNRVLTMEEDRFPRLALEQSKEKGWYCEVKKWCAKWLGQDNWPTSHKYKEVYVEVKACVVKEMWRLEPDKDVKKRFYLEDINNLDTYEEQDYLLSNISRKNRILISQLRLSSHHLHIETGRWNGTPRNERYCLGCLDLEIETEKHAFLECSAYENIRVRYGIQCQTLRELLEMHAHKLSAYLRDVWIPHGRF